MSETETQPTLDAASVAACWRCGADAKPGRKFCSKCGAPLNGAQVHAAVPHPAASLRCSNCGAENQPARRFCLECGAPLTGATGPSPGAASEMKAAEPATDNATRSTTIAQSRRSATAARAPRSSKAAPVVAVVILGVIAGGGAALVYKHRARVRVDSANSAAQTAGDGTSAASLAGPAAPDIQPAPAGGVQAANGGAANGRAAPIEAPASSAKARDAQSDRGREAVRAAPSADSRIAAGEAQGGQKTSLTPLQPRQASQAQPLVTPPVTGATASPGATVADTQAAPIALPVQTPPASPQVVGVANASPPPAAAGGKSAASAPSQPLALAAQGTTSGNATPSSPASALPAPLPAAPKTAAPMRVGGQVQAAKLIFHPQLEYPAIAKEAGVEGLVRLRAVINKDGTIKNLKIISGHRLLARTAVDGVARWRYQPTLLDGAPIEVETEIEVDFKLPH